MGIFSLKKKQTAPIASASSGIAPATPVDKEKLAELALKTIQDGILIVNKDGVVKFINPAAVDMTGCDKAEDAINLDYSLVMKFEKVDGTAVDDNNNEFSTAIKANQEFESRDFVLIAKQSEKKTPIALTMTPSGDGKSDRIITFRNIAKELEEEGAQTEFISTASHEMRTPVASIEGYLGLALNPQTATIDARARQYLESAHQASQHLGNLFRDLLDVTKLDDKRIHAKLIPLELTGFVKKFADEYMPKFKEKNLNYGYGADSTKSKRFGGGKALEQVVYTFADVDFLGEILANLIENAIKYTPEGGAVWVNVQGDGDRALINVTDTGIGIAAEDLQHIFQKFYRADNSQTRTVGGTGLGLYLVKARVEAMSGRVWAESAFGEGSTFYVSLPRLTAEEFEKRQIAAQNQRAVQMFAEQGMQSNATLATVGAPVPDVPEFNPELLTTTPATQSIQPAQPQATQPAPQATMQPTQQNATQPMPQVMTRSAQIQRAQAPVYRPTVAPTAGVAPTLRPVTMQQPVQTAMPQSNVQMVQQPVVQTAQQPNMQTMQQPVQTMQQPAMQATPQPTEPMPQPAQQPMQNNQNIIQ